VDVGCRDAEKVDYPDIAVAVCRRVVSGTASGHRAGRRGDRLLHGRQQGQGYPRRDVLRSAHRGQQPRAQQRECPHPRGPLHDAAQLAEMARTWLETRFGGGRHIVRVNKVMAIERPAEADGTRCPRPARGAATQRAGGDGK